MSLFDHSIKELENKLHNKEITVKDLVQTSLDRIEEVDANVQAFLTVNKDNALKQAEERDASPEETKLFGLPVGLSDNIVTKNLRTTSASKILENFNDPLYDATVVEKLTAEKAVTIGKLNLAEFGIGSMTEKSAFQQTRNPWNVDYAPGGANGGAAAAVAAGEVLFALASDTEGSVRIPAAQTGVVGMKPTYGRVSRFGLIAVASSMDTIGTVTKTVEDSARVLEVIAGNDPQDSTSVTTAVPNYTEALTQDVKNLKIAVPKEFLSDAVSQDVKDAVMAALKTYESLGATWEEVSLPHAKYATSVYDIIAAGEGSTGLARYDGVRYGVRSEKAQDMIDMYKLSRSEGFGDEVKRTILLGTTVLGQGYYEKYFVKAQQVRTIIKNEIDNVLADYDVIVAPTTPTTATKLGEQPGAVNQFTIPANLAGVPAISLPCGFSEAGLPIGLQVIGNYFDEATVYRAAHAFEQATDFHKQKPQLGGGAK